MNYDTQMARGRFLKSSPETTVTLPLSSPFSSLFLAGGTTSPSFSSKSSQANSLKSSKSIPANPSALKTDSLENKFR
jgi:hypothetical protein